jgi:protein-tyrosine phosphatase
MVPLVDTHCHLLAGLDDGPRSPEDALAMCRLAYDEGTRMMAATAHQNEHWPDVTPERIHQACDRLSQSLKEIGLPLVVVPCAEVMVHADLESSWSEGRLLSIADRRRYLLIELPHHGYIDLRSTVQALVERGVRPLLAHPERSEELLHEPGMIEQLIECECLVQVSAGSITRPKSRADARALKDWFRRGIVHCLGSDGHSPERRPPRLADAYRQIRLWAGSTVADRVGSTFGMAILQGLPVRPPAPEPRSRSWFSRLW